MPGIPFSMPLADGPHPVVGCPAVGDIRTQRAALADLLDRTGWPAAHKEATGRPRMGADHCSFSHGGGWAMAARHARPIGIDVEAASERLLNVAPRFCGDLDQPVLAHFGEGRDTLCRLWTAKEAVFKAFGTSVDFLTGIEWTDIQDSEAHLLAVQHQRHVHLTWHPLPGAPDLNPVWLAVAIAEVQA